MSTTKEPPIPDPFGRPILEIDVKKNFESIPTEADFGFRNGFRSAKWALVFVGYSIPLLAIALLVSAILPGGNHPFTVQSPSLLTGLLARLAGGIAFVVAGLRDGPLGVAGSLVWVLAML